MEEKKNNKGLIIGFVIVSVIAIIGIGTTFYFYNKYSKIEKKNSEISNNKINNNLEIDEINNIMDKLSTGTLVDTKESLYVFLEKTYLMTLPVHRDNNGKIVSYSLTDLTENEKKYFVWNFFSSHYDYGYYGSQPERLLKTYLGDNYEIEEFTVYDNLVLKKDNNKFIATVIYPTETDPDYIYRVNDCKMENNKLIISFNAFLYGYGIHKEYSGNAIFELNNLTLEKVDVLSYLS